MLNQDLLPHRHFVVLVDSNYIAKVAITYLTLEKHHNNFTLYAFCFDDLTYKILGKLGFKNLILISTSEFETKEFLEIKKTKTKAYEYYWTCKPYLIKKVMSDQKADIVTFIDGDFMFFANPESIFQEMGNADVLIQPNNFSSEEMKQFLPVGYYCACFISFRNNNNGKRILDWWYKKCQEWCLAVFEPGKFAEQKYLDDWKVRFKKVREITNIGANVAPWNIQKYDITLLKEKILVNNQPIIYYHYHSFRMNSVDYSYILTGDRENFYRIPASAKKYIYPPYIKLMRKMLKRLSQIQEFLQYAKTYPEGHYQMIDENKKITFASYKEAASSQYKS